MKKQVVAARRDRCSASAERVSRWENQRGFTLIELMVTIVMLAVLLGIAIPSFTESTLGSRLRSEANDLAAAALLARSEAIKRNETVRLCASSDGETCTGTWASGWIVRSAGGTVLLAHGAAPSGFLLSSSEASIDFQSSGVGATSATLTICRATPSVGGQERVVSISATGRATVSKTTTGSCS